MRKKTTRKRRNYEGVVVRVYGTFRPPLSEPIIRLFLVNDERLIHVDEALQIRLSYLPDKCPETFPINLDNGDKSIILPVHSLKVSVNNTYAKHFHNHRRVIIFHRYHLYDISYTPNFVPILRSGRRVLYPHRKVLHIRHRSLVRRLTVHLHLHDSLYVELYVRPFRYR